MLNERIKELRQSYGMSQVELAKHLGVSKQCVSNWENDNVLPSVDMLVQIAKCFRVTCDYLMGLENTQRIDISGLTEDEIAHIKLLINDLTKSHKE